MACRKEITNAIWDPVIPNPPHGKSVKRSAQTPYAGVRNLLNPAPSHVKSEAIAGNNSGAGLRRFHPFGSLRGGMTALMLCILLCPFRLTAQCTQEQKTITLDQPALPLAPTCNPQEYVGRDYVEMPPGFEYDPYDPDNNTGTNFTGSFVARVDNSMIFPVDYLSGSDIPDASNRSLDPSLPVGTIPGSANTTLTGATIYQIPIHIPPGTKGMQPNISLAYNSQRGNGPLGWGWNIEGLSTITRVPQTIFHDGQVVGVNLDANDKFALDGNRLIPTNGGSYGGVGTIYHTEIESFNQVASFGTAGNGPDWFNVKTKDGLILEFGNSADSKFIGTGGTVVFWRINKIKDLSGNSIQFIYNTALGQSRIEEIKYTINDTEGLQSYNSIKFFYALRDDENQHWIAGTSVNTKLLLRKIRTKVEGNIVKEYDLNYIKGHTEQLYSLLAEVIEYNADRSHFNSTVFEYGKPTITKFHAKTSYPITKPNTIYLAGDYDGDGLSDIIGSRIGTVGNTVLSTKLELYANVNGDIAQTEVASENLLGTLNAPYHELVDPRSDFDGDGDDDIGISQFDLSGSYKEVKTLKLYHYNPNANTLTSTDIDCSTLTHRFAPTGMNYFHPGDYNGDGSVDFITFLTNKTLFEASLYYPSKSIAKNQIDFSSPFSINLSQIAVNHVVSNSGVKKIVMDFNGDRKNDLMVLFDIVIANNAVIFEFNQDGSTVTGDILYDSSYPTINDSIYTGDFNGDGKTDLLTYSPGNSTWTIGYSDGVGFSQTSFTFNDAVDLTLDKLKISDYNGDGKSDILHGFGTSLNVYYSNGLAFTYVQNSFNNLGAPPLVSGDFNGDGNVDELSIKFLNQQLDILRFSLTHAFAQKDYLLEHISNGIDHQTSFKYQPLTLGLSKFGPPAYSSPGSNPSGPDYFQVPLYVVKELETPNGKGSLISNTFNYQNAIVHKEGRGFIGFESRSMFNQTTQKLRADFFKLDTVHFFLEPVQSGEIGCNWETNYTQTYHDYGDGRFFPYISEIEKIDFTTSTTTIESFVYDGSGNGNLESKTTEFFDGVGITSSEGTITTTMQYSTFGSWWIPSRVQNSTITKSVGTEPPYIRQVNYSYDNQGRLTQILTDPSKSKKALTSYEYNNPFGNLSKSTISASGLPSSFDIIDFDDKGRFITKRKNVLGHITTADFEPVYGSLLKQTTIDGLSIEMEYSSFGELIKTHTPEGNTITVNRDWTSGGTGALQNAIFFTETKLLGAPDVKKYFDVLGRELQSETDGFSDNIVVERAYNFKGQLESVSYPYYAGSPGNKKFINYTFHPSCDYLELEDNNGLQTKYTISGTTTAVENLNTGQVMSRTTDAMGNLLTASDDGGSVDYTYYSSGLAKTVTSNGAATSMEYDEYGRQTKLTDPNAGIIEYDYNAYGQIVFQQDANDNVYDNFQYDQAGRLISKDLTDINGQKTTYIYTYVTTGNGLENIESVIVSGSNGISYEYDRFGRVTKITETIAGQNFETQYEYDNFGNPTKMTYPSGYAMERTYNNTGYLAAVNTPQGTIFTNDEMNALNQATKYTLGNGKQTTRTFDDFGLIKSNKSEGNSIAVQDLAILWNNATGNLGKRADNLVGLNEQFMHDGLNRLNSYHVTTLSPLTVAYENNGNITDKTDAGVYTYSSTKPHAVEGVSDPEGLMPLTQDIEYTAFNRADKIIQGDYELTFAYGPSQQRKKSILTNLSTGTVEKTITYAGSYEKIEIGSDVYEVHYINTGPALAINVRQNNGADQLFYAYRDHLGSILTLTDNAGNVIYEQNFDPWGRERNPNTWDYTANPNTKPAWLIRGFTGHEHHDEVQLINMNARMYDPIVARMLSPDNYVQDATYTQTYNRYSYALNQPLRYTDPSGELLPLFFWAIAATIGVGGAMQLSGATSSQIYSTTAPLFISIATAGIPASIATSGAPFANTFSIIAGSGINAGGTFFASGGQSDVEIGFGAGSYNFTSGEFGYLGKSGNSGLQNFGYGLGAFANVSDILTGFNSVSGEVDVTTYNKDFTSHNAITKPGETDPNEAMISVAPQMRPGDPEFSHFRFVNASNENPGYANSDFAWQVRVKGVNVKRLEKIGNSLNTGAKYNTFCLNCSQHVARALTVSGVPTIGGHPFLVHAQVYARSVGLGPNFYYPWLIK